MKTIFTMEAISKGERSGTIQAPDRLLNITFAVTLAAHQNDQHQIKNYYD